jgi:hypothetical protein
MTTTAKAIVSYPPNPELNWVFTGVTPRDIEENELLVEMVATGICHTDLVMGQLPAEYQNYPRILGHEGFASLLWQIEAPTNTYLRFRLRQASRLQSDCR